MPLVLTRFVFFSFLLVGLMVPSVVQGHHGDSLKVGIEVQISVLGGSAKTLPFWVRTNRFGTVPKEEIAVTTEITLKKNYYREASVSKWDWGYSLTPLAFYSPKRAVKLLLPEGFLKVRYRRLEVIAGRRKEVMGLGDTLLSSGFYAVSGNALPIPKIQLSTIGFIPIGHTQSFLSVTAGIAHGWYQMDYLEGARLHQKYLYLRTGSPTAKVRLYAGLNHQVQWAGHAEYLKDRPDIAIDGAFPSSWKLFPYVFMAYTPKNWYEKQGFTSFDSYRMGNHLGSQDIALEGVVSGQRFLIYHQHSYEDLSGLIGKNFPDGLWGASWSPKHSQLSSGLRLKRVTLEHLTTLSQSGSTFLLADKWFQGNDDYFNHAQYQEGWSYQGKVLGTPFLMPANELKRELQQGSFFPNNRVHVWHIGLHLAFRKTTAIVKTSRSLNYGRHGGALPYSPLTQSSVGIDLHSAVGRGWVGGLLLGLDRGQLLTNTTGALLSIRRQW